MAFLSWRDEYLVGIPVIDREHRYLFDLINEFHDTRAAGSSREEVLRVLNRLVAYGEKHFQSEESLQKEVGYPGLARHQGLHASLFDALFGFAERVAADEYFAEAEVRRFLQGWLVEHIVREDMEIGDFMRRRQARDKAAAAAAATAAAATAAAQAQPVPAAEATSDEEP